MNFEKFRSQIREAGIGKWRLLKEGETPILGDISLSHGCADLIISDDQAPVKPTEVVIRLEVE